MLLGAGDQVPGEIELHVRVAEPGLFLLDDLRDLGFELEGLLVATRKRRTDQDGSELAVFADVVAVDPGTVLFGLVDLLLKLLFDGLGADFRGRFVLVEDAEIHPALFSDLVVVASEDVLVELPDVLDVGVKVLVLREEGLNHPGSVIDPAHVLGSERPDPRSDLVDEALESFRPMCLCDHGQCARVGQTLVHTLELDDAGLVVRQELGEAGLQIQP